MKIDELLKKAKSFTSEPLINLRVDKELFEKPNGRRLYNKNIRDDVSDKFGVYIWSNTKTKEIYYIGSAGKIKTSGELSNHTLKKRLIASRGRDKTTKKDIQTNDFVKNFIFQNNLDSISFDIIYTKTVVPPSYLEAILIYEFYKDLKRLPLINKSF